MKRLWIVLAVVLVFGFTGLGWAGRRVSQEVSVDGAAGGGIRGSSGAMTAGSPRP